jgi:hypothetical protein
MTDYAALAAEAAATIREEGCAMTLRVTTPGEYDPATGVDSTATVADHAAVGVLTNPFISQREAYFANSLVQSGDKVVLMGATVAVRPAAGHQVVIGSDVWQVVAVVAVEPAGVPVLYKVQVRRG